MSGSKTGIFLVVASIARIFMPQSSKSSSDDSISRSNSTSWSSSTSKESRSGGEIESRYRSSNRTSYQVHNVSESDFNDSRCDLLRAFCPPALPPPCALPGGPFSVARGPETLLAIRARDCRLRDLEMWPQDLRPKLIVQPGNGETSVVPGWPWGLPTVWENDEVLGQEGEGLGEQEEQQE